MLYLFVFIIYKKQQIVPLSVKQGNTWISRIVVLIIFEK